MLDEPPADVVLEDELDELLPPQPGEHQRQQDGEQRADDQQTGGAWRA